MSDIGSSNNFNTYEGSDCIPRHVDGFGSSRSWQATEGQPSQPRMHLPLQTRVYIRLRRRIQYRHARIAPICFNHTLLRRERRAPARLVVGTRPRKILRKDPLIVPRMPAAFRRGIVHVHDDARGQERARSGRQERVGVLNGEGCVDPCGLGRGGARVGVQLCVGLMLAMAPREGSGRVSFHRSFSSSASVRSV